MSRPTMPPGYGPNGERLDYDGPPRMPVTVMTMDELLDWAAHAGIEHPGARVGVCLIFDEGTGDEDVEIVDPEDPGWDPGENDNDPPIGWPTPEQIRIEQEGAD